MSKRNTIDYVCYNEKCKHNDNGFCQLRGVKPNGCINAISKQGYELGIAWRDKQIANLKAKLAEKDKEIESYELMLDKVLTELHTNCYSGLNITHFKEMMINDLGGIAIAQSQSKIDFAVEQLDKVKEFVDNLDTPGVESICNEYMCDIEDYIDNQIKQLKSVKDK